MKATVVPSGSSIDSPTDRFADPTSDEPAPVDLAGVEGVHRLRDAGVQTEVALVDDDRDLRRQRPRVDRGQDAALHEAGRGEEALQRQLVVAAAPRSGSLSAPSLAIVVWSDGRKGTETSVTAVPSGRVTVNVGLKPWPVT